MMDRAVFARSLPFPLPSIQTDQLFAHYELLARWNPKINLVSPRSLADAPLRHYGESIFLAQRLPAGPLSILDVGSGAGFPGFPVAVLRPDCRVTLCESDQRKGVFLKEASRGVPNVRVLVARAEALTERFDWVVSRAVRWDKQLARLAPRFALLVAAGAAKSESLPLPWDAKKVLSISENVPRGTSCDTMAAWEK